MPGPIGLWAVVWLSTCPVFGYGHKRLPFTKDHTEFCSCPAVGPPAGLVLVSLTAHPWSSQHTLSQHFPTKSQASGGPWTTRDNTWLCVTEVTLKTISVERVLFIYWEGVVFSRNSLVSGTAEGEGLPFVFLASCFTCLLRLPQRGKKCGCHSPELHRNSEASQKCPQCADLWCPGLPHGHLKSIRLGCLEAVGRAGHQLPRWLECASRAKNLYVTVSGTQRDSAIALVHLSPRSRGRALVNPFRRSHPPLLAPQAHPCTRSCCQARPPVDDPTAALPSASPLPSAGAGWSSRLTSPLRGMSGGDGWAVSLGSWLGRRCHWTGGGGSQKRTG